MNSILGAIGNTPIVEIKKLNPNPNVKIFAKLEGFNPGGSMKDRVALEMIKDAEKTGALNKGKTVIEVTNGNTGIGIAMVAAAKGYGAIIVSPNTVSTERRHVIESFGAKMILVDPEIWRQGAMNMVAQMAAKDPNLVILDQFADKENCTTYCRNIGEEILDQVNGPIDYFISCVGTGGTIAGIARQLKQKHPGIRIIGIQPKIWGGSAKSGSSPSNLNRSSPSGNHSNVLVDEILEIGEEEAQEMRQRIAKVEGILAGVSSGGALLVARRCAENLEKGTIVTIFPDRGEGYLSTEIFKN